MADRPIRSVLSRTSRSDGPISRVHKEKTRFPSRTIRFVWQDEKVEASSYGQVASDQPIKRPRSILRTNHKTEASAQPITSFGRIILRMNLRLCQSHPSVGLSSCGLSSDGSSFGRIFGSANHILRSDYLRTDFLRDQSETLKIITSHEWSRTARVMRSRSPNLIRHVIERDGRKRRKKSLYAQKPYVYVRIKSLYAQKSYIVRTNCTSYAQVSLSA